MRSFPLCAQRPKKPASTRVYTEIDLPLAPVLYRMEQAGVRIDTGVLERPFEALRR